MPNHVNTTELPSNEFRFQGAGGGGGSGGGGGGGKGEASDDLRAYALG